MDNAHVVTGSFGESQAEMTLIISHFSKIGIIMNNSRTEVLNRPTEAPHGHKAVLIHNT